MSTDNNLYTAKQKQTEEDALRQSEERYRAILENIEDVYYEVDLAGKFLFTSDNTQKILGYLKEDLLGKSYKMLMSEETINTVYKSFNQVFKTNIPSKGFDWELIGKDGQKKYVEASISLIKDADDEPTGFRGIIRDVNERKQREEALKESEAYYRLLLDTFADAVVSYDVNGNVIYVNPAFEEIFGWSADEIMGQRIDFVPPENMAETQEAIKQVFSIGRLPILNTRRLTKDGRVLDIQLSAALRRDKAGNPDGLNVILRDVSAQRQAERDVQQSQERYRILLESSPEPIAVYDTEGNATYINPAFIATFGWSAEEIIGRRIDFVPPENMPETRWAIQQVFSVGPVSGMDTRRFTKDGRILDIQLSAALYHDGEGNPAGINVILHDATAQRQAEEALRQAHDELEQRVEERTAELTKANAALLRQSEYLTALHETTLALINRLELSDLLESVIARAASLLNTTHGYVGLLDTKTNIMITRVGLGIFSNRVGRQLGFGEGAAGKVWQTGEAITIDDYQAWPDRIATAELDPIRALITVPLKSGKEVIGVTGLAHTEESHKFEPEQVELLKRFAELASIALDNARLYTLVQEELAKRKQEVQLSTQIAQEIAAATNLEDLYRRVVIQVKEQFDYYHAQLLRYDPARATLVLIAGYGETGAKMVAAGHNMPLEVGLVGTAAARGQPVLRSDVSQDPTWRPNPFLPATKGELAVPIKLGDEVLGVLDVQSDTAGALDDDDQLALEGLCGQIAIAIESTRLNVEMANRLQEVQNLQRFLSQEGWQAFQTGKQGQTRGYLFEHGSVRPLIDEIGQDIDYKLANSNTTTISENDDGGGLAMPLVVRGTVIGTLGIRGEPEKQLLAPEDQALIESISIQVAEALESARLLEQTQKRAVELEAVARVSAASSTILEVEQLVQTVVDLAAERFGLYHVAIFLLNEAGQELNLVAGSGEVGRQIAAEKLTIPLDHKRSLIARAARSRQAVIVNDVHQDANFWGHRLLPDTRAEMTIPMVVGDKVVGVLAVTSKFAHRFTSDDIRIQTTLAAQVAVAVQNAYLYAEQLETMAKLRVVDRLKSEFLASMSHELRTPLNSIIGFADVLLEGIDGELTPRMEEDVTLIRESGQHLRELIGDILDMSKIEAGMMELHHQPIDLQRMSQEVIATFSNDAQAKQIDLILDFDPAVDTIYADRTRFTQVLLNILSNAIKFTEKGSVTLSVKSENGNVRIAVIDTGIGIREEDIPIVFEQFRQVDGSLTRTVGGTGLGMPISKRLVELHGGEMGVESKLDAGSTFWFTLPKKQIPYQKPDTGPLRTRKKRS